MLSIKTQIQPHKLLVSFLLVVMLGACNNSSAKCGQDVIVQFNQLELSSKSQDVFTATIEKAGLPIKNSIMSWQASQRGENGCVLKLVAVVNAKEIMGPSFFLDLSTQMIYPDNEAASGVFSQLKAAPNDGLSIIPTQTSTPTLTPTITLTPSRTPTKTYTPTRTPTFTRTPTHTPTNTSTPLPPQTQTALAVLATQTAKAQNATATRSAIIARATLIAQYKPIASSELQLRANKHLGEAVYIRGEILIIESKYVLKMFNGYVVGLTEVHFTSSYPTTELKAWEDFGKGDVITAYGIVSGYGDTGLPLLTQAFWEK